MIIPKPKTCSIGDKIDVHGKSMRIESYSHTGENLIAISDIRDTGRFERILCILSDAEPIVGIEE
jgi:hypothetical protein